MKIKLSNNPNAEVLSSTDATTTSVTENALSKLTGLMVEGCPNVDAMTLVDAIRNYQTASGRTVRLTNLRAQLPHSTVGGSDVYGTTSTFDTLTGYSVIGGNALSGYNSNGEEQSKPAYIGTWGITDYVDSSMLETLTGDGDASGHGGLYGTNEPVISSDYRIDWSEIAVQSVDPTKPNYNPAVSIILNGMSLGESHDNTQHFPGKWWITYSDIASIADLGNSFKSRSTVTDTNGIVSSDTTAVYQFNDFNVLSGFIGVCSLAPSALAGNEYLKTVRFPNTVKRIPTHILTNCTSLTSVGELPPSVKSVETSAFMGCPNVTEMELGGGVTEIYENAFDGCGKATISALPSSLKFVMPSAFMNCSSMTVSEIPSSVAYMGTDAMNGCSGITSLHINRFGTKMAAGSGVFHGGTYPIYVGTDDSSWMCEKVRRDSASDASLSPYASRLANWYTEKYADLIPDGYEIQQFVASDGLDRIDPNVLYETGVKFVTDVSFANTPSASGDSVHGSATVGLVGKNGVGLQATVDSTTCTLITSSEGYGDAKVRNYSIDLANSEIRMNGATRMKRLNPTTGDNSRITFFGDSTRKFAGSSWMNRVTKDGAVTHDFVPVKRTSDGVIGFIDVAVDPPVFYGGANYTSNEKSLVAGPNANDSFVTEDGLVIEL